MRTALISIVLLLATALAVVWSLGRGAFGRFDSETITPVETARSFSDVAVGEAAQRAAAAMP